MSNDYGKKKKKKDPCQTEHLEPTPCLCRKRSEHSLKNVTSLAPEFVIHSDGIRRSKRVELGIRVKARSSSTVGKSQEIL